MADGVGTGAVDCGGAAGAGAGSAATGAAMEAAIDAATERSGPGDICVVEAGAGCWDSTTCCAAALTETSSAAVNIHFEVRIALSLSSFFKPISL